MALREFFGDQACHFGGGRGVRRIVFVEDEDVHVRLYGVAAFRAVMAYAGSKLRMSLRFPNAPYFSAGSDCPSRVRPCAFAGNNRELLRACKRSARCR